MKSVELGGPVPRWLLTREEYAPGTDRASFLSRGVLSLVGLLARIRDTGRTSGGRRARGHPAARIITVVLFILLLSASRSMTYVGLAAAACLAALSMRTAAEILGVLRASARIGLLTLVLALPSALWWSPLVAVRIVVKVMLCVAALRMLSGRMRWAELTRGLAALRMPDLFILVLDVTLRSIQLLGELALDMVTALSLRSVGRNRTKIVSLGGVAGTLFLTSRVMAEELYAAMECRGFTGTYRVGRTATLRPADAVLLAANAALAAGFFLTGG